MNFDRELWIGRRRIAEDESVFIIAEAGVNHNADLTLAKKMIDAAYEAGADAVKFQSFKTDALILPETGKAPYQKKTTSANENQYDMLKQLELNMESMRVLKGYCCKKGIQFLTTPFEQESLSELERLDVAAIKIAATDITNIQYLKEAAKTQKVMLLSAGMCYLEEIKKALEVIYPINKKVLLMQCTADYPIRDKDANLNVIRTFQKEFGILTGYSDHSCGIGAAPYAAAMGARVIEKHFTLDQNMQGPDHRASVTPKQLKELVQTIRKVEEYLGSAIKMPTAREQQVRKSLQKCFVATKEIKAGDRFTEKNIIGKRTGGAGISAIYYEELLGNKAKRNYQKDDIIEL